MCSYVKKAFNSVPHVTLLKHLQSLNFNEYLLNWLHSYLLERKQFVHAWELMAVTQAAYMFFQVCPKVRFWVHYCSLRT